MNTMSRVCRLFVVFIFVVLGWNIAQANNMAIEYIHPEAERLCGAIPNWDISSAKPYNPKFVSPRQQYDKTLTYDQRLLVCMKTSLPQYRANNGIGWVISPEFSRVGYNRNGAFYLGTEDGQYLRCNNKIYQIVMMEESFQTPKEYVQSTPTPTPKVLTCGAGQRISDNGLYCVETVVAYVQPCPSNLSIVGKSRFVQDRVVGSVWKKVISFGVSATGTLISGGSTGEALRNGAIGVALQTGQNMINPSEGAIVLTGEGLNKEVVLNRGKNFNWSAGEKNFQLVWQGDVATVYSSMPRQGVNNHTCFSYRPKDASNLGVYVAVDSSNSSGADKVQSVNSIPMRPYQAPSTNFPVGTMGYCSRPVAGAPAQVCQVVSGGSVVFLGNTSSYSNLPIFGN